MPAQLDYLAGAHARLTTAASPAVPWLERLAVDVLRGRFNPFSDLGLFSRSVCLVRSILG